MVSAHHRDYYEGYWLYGVFWCVGLIELVRFGLVLRILGLVRIMAVWSFGSGLGSEANSIGTTPVGTPYLEVHGT